MNIAMTGTFDVQNYGDLLFPVLAQKVFSRHGLNLTAISPVGGPPVWKDCLPSIGFGELCARIPDFSGILIGGGNIIHARPTTLPCYSADVPMHLGYADFWLGATSVANGTMPVCWNAPGVPVEIQGQLYPLTRDCLRRASYISVRDAASRAYLSSAAPDAMIHAVPDTAWAIPSVWSKEELLEDYRRIFQQAGRQIPARAIAVHLNRRYFGDMSDKDIAAEIDGLAATLQAGIVLVATGPCHKDDETMADIAGFLRQPWILHNAAAGLRQTTACLAHCMLYVGSSYHGFVVASAYGCPSICIANPSAPKFSGLVGLTRCPQSVKSSWSNLSDLGRQTLGAFDIQELEAITTSIQKQLDCHWQQIVTAWSRKPEPPRPGDVMTTLDACRVNVLLAQLNQCTADIQRSNLAGDRSRAKAKEYQLLVKSLRETQKQTTATINRTIDGLHGILPVSRNLANGFRNVRNDLRACIQADRRIPTGSPPAQIQEPGE